MRAAVALLLLAGAGAFALQLHYVWPFTADDAFITFRYAHNWVGGFGPNFNADGVRSEGVTSFGYLVISLVPQALGIDPVAFAKSLGVAAALGTAALAARLARELSEGAGLAAAFAAAVLLAFHATAIHAASGMETLIACALLAALVHAHVRFERGGPVLAIGALSLALGLVRPELNVAAGLLIAVTFVRARARRTELVRGVAASYLLPGAVYFAARAVYYGHLFPLPFYAKVPGGALFPAASGAIGFAVALLGPMALFLAVATAFAPRAVAPAWLAIGAVLALALLPDPVMNFDYRYAMPAAGVVAAVAGVGFAQLCALVAQARPRRAGVLTLAMAVATVVLLAAVRYEPAHVALRERRAYGQALAGTYVRLGRVLAAYHDGVAHRPVLAIGDAGAIPYYSGWRVIDTFSLNDPAIAVGGRHDPAYVLDQDPDLVAVVSEQGREFRAHWANRHDGPLFEAARARGMEPAVILSFSARSFLYLMAQPGSEITRYLRGVYLNRKNSVP